MSTFAEIYDCYTFTVLVTLEDYGFCKKGEGGPFVAGGAIGPGGSVPVNTGGGQLSSFYMWGMTPVSEAIVQMRGDGGRRQVPKHEVGLVSGNGGILSTHSTLVLGVASAETPSALTVNDRLAPATSWNFDHLLMCVQSANRSQQSRLSCASFSTARKQGRLMVQKCGGCGAAAISRLRAMLEVPRRNRAGCPCQGRGEVLQL